MPDDLDLNGAAPAATEIPAAPAAETVTVAEAAPAPEPAVEPAAEPAKPALHTDTETLLEGATKKDEPAAAEPKPEPEAKPEAEAKPEGEKKADEPKPEDAAAEKAAEEKPGEPAPDPAAELPPIVYEEFVLADGLKPDDEKLGDFRETLGKHRIPQEGGQELLNLHVEAMKTYAEGLAQEQHRVFGDMRAEWRKQVMADDQIGGAGHRTAMDAIVRARNSLISAAKPGTPEYAADEKSFEDMLRVTGVGDHPVFLKILHNASRRFDEPAPPPPGIKPPPNNGAKPGRRTMRDLYDKATS